MATPMTLQGITSATQGVINNDNTLITGAFNDVNKNPGIDNIQKLSETLMNSKLKHQAKVMVMKFIKEISELYMSLNK